MATTSAVRDESLGYLEDFIQAVRATRERLEGGEDLEAFEDALEAAEPLPEGVEAVGSIAVSMAEHAIAAEMAAARRQLDALRAELSRLDVKVRAVMDEIADATELWDREEEERADQLDETEARVLENLAEAAEALVELRAAIVGLEREQEGTDTEVESDLLAVGVDLAQTVAATVQALIPHLSDLESVEEAAEAARHCGSVQSVVMIVTAVVIAVLAVVAVIWTGGATLAVVAAVCAVAGDVLAVVEFSLTPEVTCGVVNATAILLREAGANECADGLLAALASAIDAMDHAAALAGDLSPMLPQVSVVSDLANGVQRLLSAINPFD